MVKIMTVFEQIKNMDIDEFTAWITVNWLYSGDLVIDWWDKTYCRKCKPEKITFPNIDHEYECSYCGEYDKCRYFTELDKMPDDLMRVKLWLQSHVN